MFLFSREINLIYEVCLMYRLFVKIYAHWNVPYFQVIYTTKALGYLVSA
jgi:hypothetical protein